MKPTESELEKLLRQAPQPTPPPGLRQEILQTAPRAAAPGDAPSAGWLARWFHSWRFAAAAAGLALATLAVVASQQAELRRLRQQTDALRLQVENRPAAQPAPAPAANDNERAELERLRAEAAQLQMEIARRSQLHTENAALQAQLSALTQQALPDEFQALRDARLRAQRISCVNNLKQLCLAVRLWAGDNNDVFPSHILAMTNEINTPKILVCPADTNRQPAASWSEFGPAHLSYEYLAADGNESQPQRVLFRCLVHRGNVGLCDGSVQQLTEAMQAQRLVTHEGKLFLDSAAAAAPAQGGQR